MPGRRRLPRATPESQGLPSAAVTGFLDAVAEAHQELHSLMVVVRGAVVAEGWWAPYERERRHELFSLSKSFTSTAVGFAQAEGLLSVDDLVLGHFPDEGPTSCGKWSSTRSSADSRPSACANPTAVDVKLLLSEKSSCWRSRSYGAHQPSATTAPRTTTMRLCSSWCASATASRNPVTAADGRPVSYTHL